MASGGRCDFDDGGSYTGTWHDGMSHGHGICTGPLGQGEYAGSWQFGFEVSGVYTWTSGNYYEGQWLQGKRHGLGVERKGHWLYRGEWTQGFKGRYGIRQSTATGLKFEGTWTAGLQDGYGVETYADGGTYQGQWLRGLRHGYGIRQSVPYDLASRYQAGALPSSTLTLPGSEREDEAALHDRDRRTEENRGGFVLLSRTTPSEEATRKKRLLLDKHGRPSLRKTIANELRLIRQKSTGDIQEARSASRQSGGSVRSTVSAMSQSSAASGKTTGSMYSEEDAGSFVSQTDLDQGATVVERYLGEWKNDKRSGYGICERSDGLKYEGEWFNNKKYGYGVTTLRDGSRLEGKYKNNVLVSSGRTSKLFILRSSKVRDRVESAVLAAHKAADIAKQKSDIANARMTSARVKCEQAEEAAKKAVADAELAKVKAREYSPNSRHPGEKIIANRLQEEDLSAEYADFEGNVEQPLQAQQSPKKFSFFKLKKDASVQGGKTDTLSRPTTSAAGASFSAAAQQQPAFTQTFHAQTTSLLPGIQSQSQTAFPKPHNSAPTPPSTSHPGGQYIMNDLRAHQQAGYRGGLNVATTGFQQNPMDRGRQVPRDNAWSPTEQQWSSTHRQPPFSQTSTLTPTPEEPVSASNVAAYSRPDGVLGTSRGRGFDDTYGSTGYEDFRERRKSLPSIVKDKQDVPVSAGDKAAAVGVSHLQTPTGSSVPQPRPHVDTYVIENGVRKRVKPLYTELPAPKALTTSDRGSLFLPKKLYELESPKLYRKGEQGSMPDVSTITDVDILPREAVYVMSQQRREALMRERAEEERRRRNQIVFRLGDLKDWCERRQVLVFVLAINISLATVFYNMLQ